LRHAIKVTDYATISGHGVYFQDYSCPYLPQTSRLICFVVVTDNGSVETAEFDPKAGAQKDTAIRPQVSTATPRRWWCSLRKNTLLVIPKPALSARNLLAPSSETADSSRD